MNLMLCNGDISLHNLNQLINKFFFASLEINKVCLN